MNKAACGAVEVVGGGGRNSDEPDPPSVMGTGQPRSLPASTASRLGPMRREGAMPAASGLGEAENPRQVG